MQPKGLQPRGMQPRGLQPKGLQPQGVQPRGLQPRAPLAQLWYLGNWRPHIVEPQSLRGAEWPLGTRTATGKQAQVTRPTSATWPWQHYCLFWPRQLLARNLAAMIHLLVLACGQR